jgi:hypothetical protein
MGKGRFVRFATFVCFGIGLQLSRSYRRPQPAYLLPMGFNVSIVVFLVFILGHQCIKHVDRALNFQQ